jgi:hypothetical protein
MVIALDWLGFVTLLVAKWASTVALGSPALQFVLVFTSFVPGDANHVVCAVAALAATSRRNNADTPKDASFNVFMDTLE